MGQRPGVFVEGVELFLEFGDGGLGAGGLEGGG